jgi:hypothetical protein
MAEKGNEVLRIEGVHVMRKASLSRRRYGGRGQKSRNWQGWVPSLRTPHSSGIATVLRASVV